MATRQQILEALKEALSGTKYEDTFLYDVVEEMILSDENKTFIGNINDDRIKRAIRLYQKFHPQRGNEIPELATMLDWFSKRSGANLAQELMEKSQKIRDILMAYGGVDPDSTMIISTDDMITMRILTKTS